MEAMGSRCNRKLDGNVEVDETFIGQKESKMVGRSKGCKKIVAVVIQRSDKGITRAYMRQIKNSGVKELKPVFEDHVALSASIRTDGWRAYTSIKRTYKSLHQEKSDKGKKFDLMHRFIMGFKSWLRGTHSSVRDLQKYLDEYVFRFNRHLVGSSIFNTIVERMANFPPKTRAMIFN